MLGDPISHGYQLAQLIPVFLELLPQLFIHIDNYMDNNSSGCLSSVNY